MVECSKALSDLHGGRRERKKEKKKPNEPLELECLVGKSDAHTFGCLLSKAHLREI